MILCVDDEPKGLQVRKMLLQRQGYRVLTANGGREALELFAANPVAAVILDYSMPGMDGSKVAAELKRLKPEVKILLLSAYLDLPQEALRFVDVRVIKGTSPISLLAALQQLLSC
jgi:CheY-like chemotaxis protein